MPHLLRIVVEGAHSVVEAVLDGVIGLLGIFFLLQNFERDFGGFRRFEAAAHAHGFEAYERMLVVDLDFKQRQRVVYAVAPIAQHACRGGAGTVVVSTEHSLEQRCIADVVPLTNPQRFEHVMFIVLVLGIGFRGPLPDSGDDFRTVVVAFHS